MSKKQLIAIVGAFLIASVGYAQSAGTVMMPQPVYGSNIVRLAPMTAMDVGVGFGAGYERLLGEEQRMSIVLPVSVLFEDKSGNNGGTQYEDSRYYAYVYFTPGLKVYPFGQRKVTYALGPNLMIGHGGGSEWQSRTDAYGIIHLDAVQTKRWRLGLLMTNYVNFQFSRHFNLGIEGGLGIRYLDKVSYSGSLFYAGNGDFNGGVDITGQFSLALGYRF